MRIKKTEISQILEAAVKREATSHNISKVLVALSGGADSIATAFILKYINLDVIALHCNFHLRGEESNRDEEFVKSFCHEYNIPLKIIDFDIESYLVQNPGVSIEMACRNLRHEWFKRQLEETKYDRIATGHNADDNIETLFLNLLRGSGSRGLKGMDIDNGVIWRPLLTFHRKDILSFIHSHDLSYVVDSTNLTSDYRRNFLRNEIIPKLKDVWKGFDTAIDRSLDCLRADNRIVEYYIDKILKEFPASISVKTIIDFPAPGLLIKRFIDPLQPYVSIPEEVLAAIKADKPHIRRWRLKKGNLILRNKKLFIEMGHCESSS